MSQDLTYITKYVKGKGPPYYYGSIIESIRKVIGKKINDIGAECKGAILFYKYHEDGQGLCMNVFPFVEKNIECIPTAYQEEVLEIIHSDRPYKDVYHIDHFHKHFHTPDHYELNPSLNEESIAKLQRITNVDQSGVTIRKSSGATEENYSWTELIRTVQENGQGSIKKNTLDQLFFPIGKEEYISIPLPVLSVPSILVVLPISGKYSVPFLLPSITELQSDVYNYLISRLIQRLDKETLGGIEGEMEFVKKFVKEVAHVMLPIGYSINGEEQEPWVREWPSARKFLENAEKHLHFKLELMCDEECYVADFELSNFYFDNTDEGYWISNQPFYKRERTQLKIRLENIFKLVYQNWDYLQNFKKKLMSELDSVWPRYWKEKMNGIDLNTSDISDMLTKLSSLSEVFREAENWKPGQDLGRELFERTEKKISDFTYYVEEERTVIIFNGVRVYDGTHEAAQDVTFMIENMNSEIPVNELPGSRSKVVSKSNFSKETRDEVMQVIHKTLKSLEVEKSLIKCCDMQVSILMKIKELPHNDYEGNRIREQIQEAYEISIKALGDSVKNSYGPFNNASDFEKYKSEKEKQLQFNMRLNTDGKSRVKNNIKTVLSKIRDNAEKKGEIEISEYFDSCFRTDLKNSVKYQHSEGFSFKVTWDNGGDF